MVQGLSMGSCAIFFMSSLTCTAALWCWGGGEGERWRTALSDPAGTLATVGIEEVEVLEVEAAMQVSTLPVPEETH